MRPFPFPLSFPALCRLPLLVALALGSATLAAQTAPKKDDPLNDEARAKRDASKVFNFIRFHAVKPAVAAPAPVPAPTRVAAAAPRAAPAPAQPQAATAPPATAAASGGAEPPPAPAVAAAAALPDPRVLPPVTEPAPVAVAAPAAAPASAPAPAPVEEEDTELKLQHYVAPELNPRAVAAISGTKAMVRVRFLVQGDGIVGKATAVGNVPRALAQVATRAVEQWRFEPIKEAREVEVDINFNLE